MRQSFRDFEFDWFGEGRLLPWEEVGSESRSLKSTTTQPAVGGPKTFWEDQRAWRPKNLAAQRAERTKVLRKQTTGRTKNI